MASKLTERCPHEAESSLEITLREAFCCLQPQLNPPFPLTIPTQEQYSQLNKAILYGILCEPHLAKVHIKYLHAVITDGYEYFTSILIKIVNEMHGKLVDSAKRQLIWVTREMVDVSAIGFDGLLVALLRQIVGGDFGEENLWLCFEMVSLFSSKWDCMLEEVPLVLTGALYVFLRLLSDHCRVMNVPKIESLRKMEKDFCVKMLREKFDLCLRIGRDLVRILQDLVHVPEFRAVWKDLLYDPSTFGVDDFLDISKLYNTRTSKWYFLLRVTPQMESQLRFLLTHVKFGSQKRYQIWFTKKFLSAPEKNAVVIDIVRFICCAHHPSNDIIHSDIIPRWAVTGWLLKSSMKNYVEANSKLALFYDWLFFNEKGKACRIALRLFWHCREFQNTNFSDAVVPLFFKSRKPTFIRWLQNNLFAVIKVDKAIIYSLFKYQRSIYPLAVLSCKHLQQIFSELVALEPKLFFRSLKIRGT